MTVINSTEAYWDVDNESLNTYARNISTIGGSRYDLPPLRGSNSQFAYRPGAAFRPKVADSRVVTLMMWVAGVDPESGEPDTTDQVVRWNDNFNSLRRLLWTPGREVALTRRWKLTDPDTDLPAIMSATAQAQIAGNLAPNMTGRTRADFAVDLLLADPYFYGSSVTSDHIDVGGSDVVVDNKGDDSTYYTGVYVDLVGPLTNPRLTNTSTNPDVWVEVSGSLTGTTTLDIGKYLIFPSSLPLNRVSHSGARSWFGLLKGNNSLSLTASAGSGYAVVRFTPPFV